MSRDDDSIAKPVAGLLLLVLVLALAVAHTCYAYQEDHHSALQSAARFQEETGIEGKITCQDVDSDGDGYVTCTLTKPDGSLLSLDCAGSVTFNSGCRLTVARVINKR